MNASATTGRDGEATSLAVELSQKDVSERRGGVIKVVAHVRQGVLNVMCTCKARIVVTLLILH